MSEQIRDHLQRRVVAMHSLWRDARESMNADQVNHVERAKVLPIAFSLFHQTRMEDDCAAILGSPGVIYNAEWSERIGPGVDDHGKERTVDEMMEQRLSDYDAFIDYQQAVFSQTEEWLASLDPDSLSQLIIPRPLPDQVASTFSARVAGPEGLTRLDAIECWIYQHGLRHMGEIEHARALVGLGGMTS